MKYCRVSYSIVILLLLTFFTALPQSAHAVAATKIPIPQFSQHLVIPDTNGDTGYFNCAIAASAMSLQAIAETATNFDREDFSYGAVRSVVRSAFPNIQKGITLRETARIIPALTDHQLHAAFVTIDQSSWRREVRRQLDAGFPIIVHMSDWSYLEGHAGKEKSAHAIVLSGIDEDSVAYVDPWDGKEHTVSHASFVRAWSQGHYRWHAVVFIQNKKASDFSELMRHYSARRQT